MSSAPNSRPSPAFAMLSDVGQARANNEDTCLAQADLQLFAVCDGMGGAAGGEVASALAASTFAAEVRRRQIDRAPERTLREAILAANRAVLQRAEDQPSLKGMGTTLVGLQIDPESRCVYVVHAGDSRCYRMRDGALDCLTRDHTLVEERRQLGLGSASKASDSRLRHVLTRAVGVQPELEPELLQAAALPGDLYLLCSDGLTGQLAEPAIASLLRHQSGDLPRLAQGLVTAANDAGGDDNITVVLVRLQG